jgi:hypothetical protein
MMRVLSCVLMLVGACDFEIETTTSSVVGSEQPGPVFESPRPETFNVRPLPRKGRPNGRPSRRTIEKMLGPDGRKWEFMAHEYSVSTPSRLSLELGDRVGLDVPADWNPDSAWLLSLSEDVLPGKPVTVVAAHRRDTEGHRIRLLILGGEGRPVADRGEAAAITDTVQGVSVETSVSSEHAPPFAGTFFAMAIPGGSEGTFLTHEIGSRFTLGAWAHVPANGGSSMNHNVHNGVTSVSFSSGPVAISGDGITWTIRVNGQPTPVPDYPHVAWVVRGIFEARD